MFQRFPYTNGHELNLDWILDEIRGMELQGDVPAYMQDANIYNVHSFGATGDGIQDDTDAIQDAMDAAISGGIIYFPAGEYIITDNLKVPENVTLAGTGIRSTKISISGTGKAVLDVSHKTLDGIVIRDMWLHSDTSRQNIGILGGCTLAEYNSGIFTVEHVMMDGFNVGVYGGASVGGIGIFDSVFRDVWIFDCDTGFQCLGSGNLYEHCRLTVCINGMVLDHLSTESLDGGWLVGCLFISNTRDIWINGNIRPINFQSCWFEQSAEGILAVANANTRCPVLVFRDCLLSTHSTTAECLNFYNLGGGLQVIDSCQFFQEQQSYKAGYTASQYGGTLRVHDTLSTAYNGTDTVLDT